MSVGTGRGSFSVSCTDPFRTENTVTNTTDTKWYWYCDIFSLDPLDLDTSKRFLIRLSTCACWIYQRLFVHRSLRSRDLFNEIRSFERNCSKSSVRSGDLFDQIRSFERSCSKNYVRSKDLFDQISSYQRSFRTVHQIRTKTELEGV